MSVNIEDMKDYGDKMVSAIENIAAVSEETAACSEETSASVQKQFKHSMYKKKRNF